MEIKIVNLGDVHIRPLKGHEPTKEVFNNLFEKIKTIKPNRIVITGDIAHSKINVSNEYFLLLGEFLTALADLTDLLIIIAGNHDTIVSSDRVDSITPVVKLLNNPKIKYYKESGCYQDELDSNLVYCVWSVFEDQKTPDIEAWKFLNDPEWKKQYIGLYHGVISGCNLANDFTLTNGIETEEFVECDVVFASDIHQYQEFKQVNNADNEISIVYTSSTMQQSFGESVDNHGFVLWSFMHDKWSHVYVDIENPYNYFTVELEGFNSLNLDVE